MKAKTFPEGPEKVFCLLLLLYIKVQDASAMPPHYISN